MLRIVLALLIFNMFQCFPAIAERNKKKQEAVPRIYPKERLIQVQCDLVWSAAIPVLTDAGFVPNALDREGGTAAFRYARGGSNTPNNDIKTFTTAPAGFWNFYSALVIDSGTLIVSTSGESDCSTHLSIAYIAHRRPKVGPDSWVALESNGFAESSLLAKIASRAIENKEKFSKSEPQKTSR